MPIDLIHRENLIDTLRIDLRNRLESVSVAHQAFVRLAAEWLGYNELDEEKHFVDGAGDRGIDFWYASDSSIEIFQVKSHELGPNGEIKTDKFGSEGVQDLQRAKNLLIDEISPSPINLGLRELKRHLEYMINKRLLADTEEESLQVNLGLILFGEGLTDPAKSEYHSLLNVNQSHTYKKVIIRFRPKVYTLDDIIMYRWREDNREWRDKNGKKRSDILLHPKFHKDQPQWIPGSHNTVFYCKAVDLINAFEDFGYQLFEPNVRAHISKSKVNDEIKKSLMHNVSRKEFQFLNNGLTITCKNYKVPSENSPYFRITEPGIVNGLQTVVSMNEAFFELDQEEKKHLQENCYVLVRLLSQKAVKDINKVVLASNTQNPMQARNLKSNTSEQIYYERLFADLGWFYERKQGAWNAFSSDPSRWRTLLNKRKSNFKVDTGVRGRPKNRIVDNETLAQTWIAFIGFSDDAVHKKKSIFEDDYMYNLTFLRRTPRHAKEYGFRPSTAQDEWIDGAPSPALMLVSYIVREFAREASLSSRKNRELACECLNLDPESIPKEELDGKLAQDDSYLLEQVLSAMSFVFVEFFGYILYKALGARLHSFGQVLLDNGSLKYLKETNEFDSVITKVRKEEVEGMDLLVTAWFAFRHVIDQLMAGPWKQSYQTARNRSRFNLSADTRMRIYKQTDDLDKFMTISQLTQVWTANIPGKTGLYQYFRNVLTQTSISKKES